MFTFCVYTSLKCFYYGLKAGDPKKLLCLIWILNFSKIVKSLLQHCDIRRLKG